MRLFTVFKSFAHFQSMKIEMTSAASPESFKTFCANSLSFRFSSEIRWWNSKCEHLNCETGELIARQLILLFEAWHSFVLVCKKLKLQSAKHFHDEQSGNSSLPCLVERDKYNCERRSIGQRLHDLFYNLLHVGDQLWLRITSFVCACALWAYGGHKCFAPTTRTHG